MKFGDNKFKSIIVFLFVYLSIVMIAILMPDKYVNFIKDGPKLYKYISLFVICIPLLIVYADLVEAFKKKK